MRSSNPTLNAFEESRFTIPDEMAAVPARSNSMTYVGTASKLGVLVGLCAAAAIFTWMQFVAPAFTGSGSIGSLFPWFLGGAIGTLALSLVICFAPRTAPFLAPVYALAEGATLAIFSGFIAGRYLADFANAEGLIFQAIGLTFAIAGALALMFAAGWIRVGSTTMKVVCVALGGLIIYSLAIILGNGVFGLGIPNLYASASPLGIGFTVLCLVIASIVLVMDLQIVEAGVEGGAPKHMEWYGGFAILVTLAWMYIEILRLLAKLRSGD